MCAVLGAYLKNPTASDLELVSRLLLESSIRGLHATGATMFTKKGLRTIIEPAPAMEWLNRHKPSIGNSVNSDGEFYMVAHCRYSTSDLAYNQPMFSEHFSIVHNGVITQEMPENWLNLYGFECKTRNDSELILKCLENGLTDVAISPLERFPDASMAVIELYKEKKIRFYRNGKRPLYLTNVSNGYIITSTADIPRRAGLKDFSLIDMNTYYTIEGDSLSKQFVNIPGAVDLQNG